MFGTICVFFLNSVFVISLSTNNFYNGFYVIFTWFSGASFPPIIASNNPFISKFIISFYFHLCNFNFWVFKTNNCYISTHDMEREFTFLSHIPHLIFHNIPINIYLLYSQHKSAKILHNYLVRSCFKEFQPFLLSFSFLHYLQTLYRT